MVTDYNHDGSGNRTTVTGGVAPGTYALAAGVGATVHEYGDTPHESFTRAYDANGNYTGDQGSAVVGIGYNADNLMVWYVDDTGTDEAYRYDASNRRVRIDRNGAVDRYFLYLGDRILEEYTATGTLAASHVYGNYVDEVLQRRDETTGTDHYYFTDDQWNVVALTTTAGSVVERYTYDDFGAPTVTDAAWAPLTGNASAVGNTRLFQGRDYDYATALYHYRARYYDPATGRFTTRDPLGIWGDVLHLGNGYSFLNNNPWSMIDPYGMEAGSNMKNPIVAGFLEFVTAYNEGWMDFYAGFFVDGLWGDISGAAQMVMHPGQVYAGFKQVAHAIWNDPDGTFSTLRDEFMANLGTPRMLGQLTYTVLSAWATGGSALGAKLTGRLGKFSDVMASVGRAGPDIPGASSMDSIGSAVGSSGRTDFLFMNKVGKFYPNIVDPRTGRPIPFPTGELRHIDKEFRTVWNNEKRGEFIKQWHEQGFETPVGGWKNYQLHHIRPLQFGGTNDFSNLVPLQIESHKEFNRFWVNM